MCSMHEGNDLGLTDKNSACTCGTTASGHQHGAGQEHGHQHDAGHGHGHGHLTTQQADPEAGPIHSEFLVSGMTCSHCVSSVTEELSALDGVHGVRVELNAGGLSKVTVASDSALDGGAVRAAVVEAGYELADAAR